MEGTRLAERYQELQDYVGWTEEDARRVSALAALVEPHFPMLIEDFYEELQRHPGAVRVITGGPAQIQRLKGTLLGWLRELVSGQYDQPYVERRWRVGWRHVEIGLDQVYTNVALSRLRTGLIRAVQESWRGELNDQRAAVRSLNKLIDLDLAIIEDAYQAEHAARLQQSERLATLGQVAGGIAHELRNPLNVVRTSVYYLLNARNPTPAKQAEHLHRIERNVQLSDNVITVLSRFARMPAPSLQPTPIGPVIQAALETEPEREGITVVVDCPEELPDVLADSDQLRIVLGNLIRNAQDAMPEGGTLTIKGRAEGTGLSLEMIDTGVGMAPEEQARILEPLYSTKTRGLGLGLAIVRAILDKMGAQLGVESALGHGSTFTLALPGDQSPQEDTR